MQSTFVHIAMSLLAAVIYAVPTVLGLCIAVLLIRALLKYLRTSDVREEKALLRRSLSEVLREHRMRCGMTQEFVAESLGVSRQAVSKWERGASDPSTSNLIELARLYGVPAEELLLSVSGAAHPAEEGEQPNGKEAQR